MRIFSFILLHVIVSGTDETSVSIAPITKSQADEACNSLKEGSYCKDKVLDAPAVCYDIFHDSDVTKPVTCEYAVAAMPVTSEIQKPAVSYISRAKSAAYAVAPYVPIFILLLFLNGSLPWMNQVELNEHVHSLTEVPLVNAAVDAELASYPNKEVNLRVIHTLLNIGKRDDFAETVIAKGQMASSINTRYVLRGGVASVAKAVGFEIPSIPCTWFKSENCVKVLNQLYRKVSVLIHSDKFNTYPKETLAEVTRVWQDLTGK